MRRASLFTFILASGISIASVAAETQTSMETANTEVSKEVSKKAVQVPEAVQKSIQEKGFTRVIIGLDANFQPEGELTPDEIQEQRARIARVQEQFLNGLKETLLPINEDKFSTVPYIVIYMNETILQYIVQNKLVTSIEMDGLGSSGVGSDSAN
jgi:RNase H-fold protein (predicted Holliday junction resolvase)